MKKTVLLIGLLLIAVFIFASCEKAPSKDPAVSEESEDIDHAASEESEGLDYIIDKEAGSVKISGRGDCHDAKIVIPKQIMGYPVTGIAKEAFKDDVNLIGIVFPQSVISIGRTAFYNCSDLASITIPDGVTSIEKQSFWFCESLTSVTIPDSVTRIGGYVFYECGNLTDITYQGTKAQWNAISKDGYWNYSTGSYTIHCTDGDIAK